MLENQISKKEKRSFDDRHEIIENDPMEIPLNINFSATKNFEFSAPISKWITIKGIHPDDYLYYKFRIDEHVGPISSEYFDPTKKEFYLRFQDEESSKKAILFKGTYFRDDPVIIEFCANEDVLECDPLFFKNDPSFQDNHKISIKNQKLGTTDSKFLEFQPVTFLSNMISLFKTIFRNLIPNTILDSQDEFDN